MSASIREEAHALISSSAWVFPTGQIYIFSIYLFTNKEWNWE